MKTIIEIAHQDYGEVKPRIAPFLEGLDPLKRSSLPACIRYEFEADDALASAIHDALGRDGWSFEANVFRKKA